MSRIKFVWWRSDGFESVTHVFGDDREQFQQMMVRNIVARPDADREIVVVLGAFDQHAVAALGESRAGIVDGGQHDRPVTALDQHVGDDFADRGALRDRQQMILAGRPCGCRQGVVVEPGEVRRTGPATSISWSTASLRIRFGGTFGIVASRRASAARTEVSISSVRRTMTSSNSGNLAVGISRPRRQEQIGHAAQRVGAISDRPVGQRLLEFFDNGSMGAHCTHFLFRAVRAVSPENTLSTASNTIFAAGAGRPNR